MTARMNAGPRRLRHRLPQSFARESALLSNTRNPRQTPKASFPAPGRPPIGLCPGGEMRPAPRPGEGIPPLAVSMTGPGLRPWRLWPGDRRPHRGPADSGRLLRRGGAPGPRAGAAAGSTRRTSASATSTSRPVTGRPGRNWPIARTGASSIRWCAAIHRRRPPARNGHLRVCPGASPRWVCQGSHHALALLSSSAVHPHGRPAALLGAVWRACGARQGHRDGPGIARSDERSRIPAAASPASPGSGRCTWIW